MKPPHLGLLHEGIDVALECGMQHHCPSMGDIDDVLESSADEEEEEEEEAR